MQEDVDEVIREKRVIPQERLQPESRMDDRVVLLRRSGLEPDSREPVPRAQSRPRHVAIVIPQQRAVQRWRVRDEDRHGQERKQPE